MDLDIAAFQAAGFAGRIRVTNQAGRTRLWSAQLAMVWGNVIDRLGYAGSGDAATVRQLQRELIALAPDTTAAKQDYRVLMGDHGRQGARAFRTPRGLS